MHTVVSFLASLIFGAASFVAAQENAAKDQEAPALAPARAETGGEPADAGAGATRATGATGANQESQVAAEPEDKPKPKPEPVKPRTWVDDYEELLQKYVTASGVKYKAWHGSTADRAALRTVVNAIASQDVSTMSRDEKLAFYLNAYNAWILNRILQDYPTDGPGGGGFFGRNSFFKSDDIRVAGKKTSFTDLENEIIRPKFKEPRIHFALNCASRSCPPLHTKAFRAETLNETLTTLTRAFVTNNRNGVIVSKNGRRGSKVQVSKIFDWYEDDFKGGTVSYINRYRDSKIPNNARVSFQDYSWILNEAR